MNTTECIGIPIEFSEFDKSVNHHLAPNNFSDGGRMEWNIGFKEINTSIVLGNKMKSTLKVLLASVLSTLAILVLLIAIGMLFIPQLGVHITYPIRLLKGTDMYEGETKAIEVLRIWEWVIIPLIFLGSVIFFYRRNIKSCRP